MKRHSKDVVLVGICMLLWVANLPAQAPDTLWTRIYGGIYVDVGFSVQQTLDGGYIITGYTESFGAGSTDLWLLKTYANGDTVWTKSYGGTGLEEGRSVRQTLDGGYIITGSTESFGAGASDVWLLKTTANGDTVWAKTYGGGSVDYSLSVQQASDSGYIVAGATRSFGVGSDDVYLIKVNADGTPLWTNTYGGIGSDYGQSIQQTSDGGYIVAGRTMSFGPGISNVYLIKTDANGDTMWTKTYGEAGHLAVGFSVKQTSDQGYIIAGCITSGPGQTYGYLIKTDTIGDTLWTKQYGEGGDYDWLVSVQQTSDEGYIVAGFTDSQGAGSLDVWLIRTYVNGDTIWTQTYGGTSDEAGYSLQKTSDEGYIIVGATNSSGAGSDDLWLIKTEPDTLGIREQEVTTEKSGNFGTTIFGEELLLPEGKKCRVFDITGRAVMPDRIGPGIYFIEFDGQIARKVVKTR